MIAVFLVLMLLAASPASAAYEPGSLTGIVTHVRDGDTVEVDGLPIRLQGLAAPERHEPGGPEATAAMEEQIALGRHVRCELTGERSWDRCVGSCSIGGDLSAELARRGLARDCPAFSTGGRYASSQGATIGAWYQLPDYCGEE